MNKDQVWSGRTFLGIPQEKSPGRKLVFKTKDFSATDQAVPVPVFYGTVKIAGIYITPITGFRSVEIKQEVGK